jgi:hypothetical protein
MTARTLSALLFGAAVLIGCGPTLQVKTDFDHAVQFARYRTFQMGEGRVIEKGTASMRPSPAASRRAASSRARTTPI